MIREDSYEALCQAQKEPYLQWLAGQEQVFEREEKQEKGKQIVRLPFLSCMDSWVWCLTQGGIEPTDGSDETLWLFYRTEGKLEERAELAFGSTGDIFYADEDYLDNESGRRCAPWFKPDYSPDTLKSFFYYGSIFAINAGYAVRMWKQLCQETGPINDTNVSIYEFMVYASGQTANIRHIPQVLYTSHNRDRIQELPGRGCGFECIRTTNWWRMYHGREYDEDTCISVIIPSKDNGEVLLRCLNTLLEKTQYPQYELIIVDNGSSNENRQWITSRLCTLQETYHKTIKYLYNSQPFNFSAMCNYGARQAAGKYLLFLNDDMEILDGRWMTRMLELAVLSHVGAVGAKLLYPKAQGEEAYRIQHVGITNMGIGPAHKLAGMIDEGCLYHGHNLVNYDMIAVTAACLMIGAEKFKDVGGFDEELAVAYNDVELCFRIYEQGYLNVVCNEAVLIHHESLSRGQDDTEEKKRRLAGESRLLYAKHPGIKNRDPFYSGNLVQWKKDVEYSCNYLYPCDKIVQVIPSDNRKLPKVHSNRWLRRLTGENQSMLQIDTVEVTEDIIEIKGWYVLREHDNGELIRHLLLRNEANGVVYQAALYPQLREDVELLFAQEAHTTRTALAGIHALIDKSKLPQGEYTIGILAQAAAGGIGKHGKRIQYAQGRGFIL